jgi:hypothetical protein
VGGSGDPAHNEAQGKKPDRKKMIMNREYPNVLMVMVLSILLAAGVAHAVADELLVVADEASSYVIAWAEDADEKKITEATELLSSLIAEATGVKLPQVKESEVPAGTPAIYLGRSAAARRAGLPVDKVKGWGYLHRAIGDNIFLVGEDVPGDGKVGGFSGYSGTLKAVTAFLEEEVGVRFLLPGAMGTHVPQLERLVVNANMARSWSPLFQFVIGRRVSPPSGQHEYAPYAIANNWFGRYSNDTKLHRHPRPRRTGAEALRSGRRLSRARRQSQR